MPLTRPIPQELREKFSRDPFYAQCCIGDETCSGRIQWHHNGNYAGTRMDDEWSILPACEGHHDRARETEIHERFDWVMLNRADLDNLTARYPKYNWKQRFKYLQSVYDK